MVYALKGLVQLSEQKSGWKGGFPVATSCGAPQALLKDCSEIMVESDVVVEC